VTVDSEPVEDRLRAIQLITDAALSGLDDRELLAELLDRAREVLRADTAAVLLLDFSSGQLIATAAVGLEEEVRQGVRIPVGRGFAGRIAAGNQPVILDHVDHTTVLNPILLSKGIRSMMGVPMVAGGRVIGVMHVGSLTSRRFTGDDIELLQLAADRAAAAVQSMTAQADRIAAAALHRSLVPAALPTVAGAELAARYIPGDGGVGGDWYDVFTLPSGELCVVMGDVVGSGLPAAVIMGRMRSALRAYALQTRDPAEVLARLDRKVQYFEPDAMATVLYAVIDPALDRMHVCLAGHFPPVIARPGHQAELARVTPAIVIGVSAGAERPVTTVPIPAGAMVCFYTDGLIERPGEVIDDGLARLCRAVTAESAEAACAAVMQALVGSEPTRDDIALLMLRRQAVPPVTGSRDRRRTVTSEAGFPVHMVSGVPVVAAPEEIDVANAGRLRTALLDAAVHGHGRFVVDLTRTRFCDTAGLHALVAAHRRTLTEGGQVLLVTPGTGILRIFQITGLDRVIPHAASLEEALARVPGAQAWPSADGRPARDRSPRLG
jgi:phosphoserine phosphatase RsbU/P